MTRPVTREEIADYQTYDQELRPARRPRILETKRRRRVHVGEYLTFLFENHDTALYQIQEIMRAEQLVKESDILHELEVYNEMLGGTGELGCVLLIEIEDEAVRPARLREWQELPGSLYVELEDGTRVRPTWDERQRGEDRLSSVQYLRFDTGGRVPVAVGTDLEALTVRTELDDTQRAALGEDLSEDRERTSPSAVT